MVEQVQILFQALGLTLLHFCWQGAIIAVAAKMVSIALPGLRPRAHYAISLGAMLVMAATAVATFAWEQARLGRGEQALTQEATAIGAAILPQGLDPMSLLPWLDGIWAAGVLILALRTVGGLRAIRRLKAGAQLVPEALAARFARAARLLGLTNVHIRMHAGIDSPFVVGVFRSIVYLPVSAVMTLSPDQIDAVLAHELEHIRRADFAWNLLQTVLETLFFYHPAVWWLGRRLREQRELACDDAAVRTCADPMTYATALLRLEEQRRTTPHLAVALNGDGSGPTLLSRVRRILGDTPKGAQPMSPRKISRPALLAAPVVLITLAALAVPAAQVVAGTEGSLAKICNIKSLESITGSSGLSSSLAFSDSSEVAGPETPAAEASDGDVEPKDFWSDLMMQDGAKGEGETEDSHNKAWTWVAQIDHAAIASAQIEGLTQGAEDTHREAERLKASDPARARQLQAASDRMAAQARAAQDNAEAQAQNAEAMKDNAEIMAYNAEISERDMEAIQRKAELSARKAEKIARKIEAQFNKAKFKEAWDFPAPPEPPAAPDAPLPPEPAAPPSPPAFNVPPAPPAPPAKPMAVVSSVVHVRTHVVTVPQSQVVVNIQRVNATSKAAANTKASSAVRRTPSPIIVNVERKIEIG